MKNTHKFENIIPACYAETLLMKTLGYLCHENHQSGDGNVINALQKQKDKKIKFIGVMDKPQGTSPSHIKSEYVDQEKGPNNLILKKHKKNNHYIIYIDELLEDWIIRVGKSKKIQSPYSEFQTFKEEMKSSRLLTNKRILRYFDEIKTQKPDSFRMIVQWIDKVEAS